MSDLGSIKDDKVAEVFATSNRPANGGTIPKGSGSSWDRASAAQAQSEGYAETAAAEATEREQAYWALVDPAYKDSRYPDAERNRIVAAIDKIEGESQRTATRRMKEQMLQTREDQDAYRVFPMTRLAHRLYSRNGVAVFGGGYSSMVMIHRGVLVGVAQTRRHRSPHAAIREGEAAKLDLTGKQKRTRTDGTTFWSYNTVIARKLDVAQHIAWVSTKNWSQDTRGHQRALERALEKAGWTVIGGEQPPVSDAAVRAEAAKVRAQKTPEVAYGEEEQAELARLEKIVVDMERAHAGRRPNPHPHLVLDFHIPLHPTPEQVEFGSAYFYGRYSEALVGTRAFQAAVAVATTRDRLWPWTDQRDPMKAKTLAKAAERMKWMKANRPDKDVAYRDPQQFPAPANDAEIVRLSEAQKKQLARANAVYYNADEAIVFDVDTSGRYTFTLLPLTQALWLGYQAEVRAQLESPVLEVGVSLSDVVDFLGGGERGTWLRNQPDLATAWAVCPRGDWMLGIAGSLGVDRKILVAAALDCAETALQFVRPQDLEVVRNCIHVTREWIEGRASLAEATVARAAAYAAATSVSNTASDATTIPTRASAYAAYAATNAAVYAASVAEASVAGATNASTNAATHTATYAYAAAYDAATATAAADADAAGQASLRETARLVRARIPYELIRVAANQSARARSRRVHGSLLSSIATTPQIDWYSKRLSYTTELTNALASLAGAIERASDGAQHMGEMREVAGRIRLLIRSLRTIAPRDFIYSCFTIFSTTIAFVLGNDSIGTHAVGEFPSVRQVPNDSPVEAMQRTMVSLAFYARAMLTAEEIAFWNGLNGNVPFVRWMQAVAAAPEIGSVAPAESRFALIEMLEPDELIDQAAGWPEYYRWRAEQRRHDATLISRHSLDLDDPPQVVAQRLARQTAQAADAAAAARRTTAQAEADAAYTAARDAAWERAGLGAFEARDAAYAWHGGQGSALYSFVSADLHIENEAMRAQLIDEIEAAQRIATENLSVNPGSEQEAAIAKLASLLAVVHVLPVRHPTFTLSPEISLVGRRVVFLPSGGSYRPQRLVVAGSGTDLARSLADTIELWTNGPRMLEVRHGNDNFIETGATDNGGVVVWQIEGVHVLIGDDEGLVVGQNNDGDLVISYGSGYLIATQEDFDEGRLTVVDVPPHEALVSGQALPPIQNSSVGANVLFLTTQSRPDAETSNRHIVEAGAVGVILSVGTARGPNAADSLVVRLSNSGSEIYIYSDDLNVANVASAHDAEAARITADEQLTPDVFGPGDIVVLNGDHAVMDPMPGGVTTIFGGEGGVVVGRQTPLRSERYVVEFDGGARVSVDPQDAHLAGNPDDWGQYTSRRLRLQQAEAMRGETNGVIRVGSLVSLNRVVLAAIDPDGVPRRIKAAGTVCMISRIGSSSVAQQEQSLQVEFADRSSATVQPADFTVMTTAYNVVLDDEFLRRQRELRAQPDDSVLRMQNFIEREQRWDILTPSGPSSPRVAPPPSAIDRFRLIELEGIRQFATLRFWEK